jgi:mannose-6-phosphate isomerase-like protein (cupin superfamily)
MNRREAVGSLSAFALLGSLMGAQTAESAGSVEIKVFKPADMPVSRNPAGAAGWGVPQTLVPQGDITEVHVTTLEPGKEFGPMRKNPNYAFRMILSGKMEVLAEGKPPLSAETGDVVYAPADQNYQVRNSGDMSLTYFVVQVKPRTASA